MFHHIELGKPVFSRKRKLKALIEKGEIILGGNRQLKIYGTLSCKSGKRMKIENRVFFGSEKEAIEHGYRPCGNCMRNRYQKWNNILFPLFFL
ncbi:MAG: Ada metal-binding domain-containing protein [Ferruginibacter sp.]